MLVVLITIVILCLYVILLWMNQMKYRKQLAQFPGPKPLPLLGNLLLLKSTADVVPVSMRVWKGILGSFIVYLGPQPRLVVCDPKTAEFVLSSTSIIDKSYEYSFFHDWLGTGLLTSTGQKWKSQRKLLTPAFHFQILEKYIKIFNRQSNTLIDMLKPKVENGPFDVFPLVTLCTLDIICEAAMGVQINAQKNSTSSYVLSVKEMCRIITERALSVTKMIHFLYKFTWAYQQQRKVLSILQGFTNSIIRSRKSTFTGRTLHERSDEGLSKRVAFLDLLLEYNLSDETVREEVDTFMFEGHDTTAAGISFTLYCLAKHPDVQRKVVEELRRIFYCDKDRAPTYKDVQEMKYLEMVIKESLRLYPPVPSFSRVLTQDVPFDESLLPKGLVLTLYPLLLHRDPTSFPDSEKFDPDRFLPENSATRSPYAYVPFSAGPRNCIGQRFAMVELKSTISNILRNFEILPVAGHEPELSLEVILKSYNGLRIQLKSRTFLLVIIIVVSSLICWFIKLWLEQLKYRRYLSPYSGPKPLPLLGNVLLFKSLADFVPITKRLAEEFGKSFILFFGPKPRLLVGEHETAEFLLSSKTIIDKSYEYSYFHDWLGTGLLTSTGQKWKSRRKLLTPAFHFQILDKYIDVFNKQGHILVEKLKERADSGPFDIFPYVTLCTLDIIGETAMGVQINAQTDSTSSYVWSVKQMCRIILERTVTPLNMINVIYKLTPTYRLQKKAISILHGFTNSVIRSRKANFTRTILNGGNDEGLLKRVAFLDLLLQYDLSDQSIREEVDTFMFEGHDTTASGISFTLYCLSKHPYAQVQVVEELRTIFSGDKSRESTYQDLQEMKYLEMVIKESMRLYPPVPLFSRILNESASFNGALLPQGFVCALYVLQLHRNPDIFPDPEKFDPDRFLPENSKSRPPYAYVPFSAGLRNCIGQRFAILEMKATISKILRNFEILPVPDHEPQLSIEAILKSYNGLPIVLKARSF
ncbi:uncharacterized protein LOC116170124 [Photinus pyralis]|nr:uncharacterized protein LOC116170124 [Photinus pyralis]